MSIRSYEAVLVLEDISVENKEKAISDLKEIFSKRKATVEDQEMWGNRDLYHPAKKKSRGSFYLFKFRVSSENIVSLRSDLKIAPKLLKYFITLAPEKAELNMQDGK